MLPAGAGAPDFELPDLAGSSTRLSGMQGDTPLLVVFFKVSCPTCQLAMPFLDRLGDRMIAVSQDAAQATQAFRERFGLTGRVLLDPPGSYPASNAYRITNVPSLFLVEPDGTISHASHGFDRREFEQLGKRLGVALFRDGERTPDFKPG